MPLLYHPNPGEILICSYPEGMEPPEMVKSRPVVVISPKLKHRTGLVTIVPLSTTQPEYEMPYHHKITLERPLPRPWDGNPFWAICDHVITVGFKRVSLIKIGKDRYGGRQYARFKLDDSDLNAVKNCVLHGLGMSHFRAAENFSDF